MYQKISICKTNSNLQINILSAIIKAFIFTQSYKLLRTKLIYIKKYHNFLIILSQMWQKKFDRLFQKKITFLMKTLVLKIIKSYVKK